MTVPELIASGVQPSRLPTADLAATIVEQAKRHTTRGGIRSLLDSVRPNEPERVKDYRVKTARNLTQEGVKRYLNKVSRIFRSVTVIDEQNISEPLQEYLETKPFYFAGKKMSLEDFFYSCVIQMAIEDPNAVLVPFPVTPGRPEINPSADEREGGLSPTEVVGIKNQIIPSRLIVEDSQDILGWVHEVKQIPKGNTTAEAEAFYMADAEAWYYVDPIRYEQVKDDQGKVRWEIVYETVLWYRHDTGDRPGIRLPGDTKKYDESHDVNESFLWIYYEYADEFISAFSDNQAVRVRHSYPKVIMSEVPCPDKACNGGYKTRKDVNGETQNYPCETCGGTGVIRDPGPHDILVKDRTLDGEVLKDVLQYVTPDTSILDMSYNTPFDLLKRGKMAIGLDLLESLQESGVAKEYRLEDLQDQLKVVGDAFTDVMETYLYQVEALLVVNQEDRNPPILKRPEQYTVKSSYMLLEDAKNALPSDRVTKSMQYFKVAYKGDAKTIRIFHLAHAYAPLFGLDGEDLKIRISSGIYGEADLVKADRALWALNEIAEDLGDRFYDTDDEEIFRLADEKIEPYLPEPMIPVMAQDDNNPDPDPEPPGDPQAE